MLVLGRKVGQEVVMPQYGITITVVDIRGGQIRLEITAPREVQVFRREVLERLAEVPSIGEEEAVAPAR